MIAGGLLAGPGPKSAEAALLTEVKKLLSSDAQSSGFFGKSVAVSGNTAVVGAYGEDEGNPFDDFGAAYVVQRDQGGADNWGEVKKITAAGAQAGDWFGISVAVSGNTAVVGAYQAEVGGGAAYVFERDQGGVDNWGQVKKLTASNIQYNDRFGVSVAVSGDTIVVGAYWEDGA
ncbi:MAG: FG-GAP repeat protein, partial [Chloroflexi bacterium]|nr:FG-GAP repeat protein [Chloroflexota bacterium]